MNGMTVFSAILAFFPLAHALSVLAALLLSVRALATGDLMSAAVFGSLTLFNLYLLAPLLFRLHERFFPLQSEVSRIDSSEVDNRYSPWWGGHQLQGLYISFPTIESALRLVPGAYSAWLRLWGSVVGRGVYWTPRVQILDRSLVKIGDSVIFGHEVDLCSHVVMKTKKGLRLYVKEVEIGSDCLIGAHTALGPGVRVEDKVSLPYGTHGPVNHLFSAEVAHERAQ